jgi:hypothetical protein
MPAGSLPRLRSRSLRGTLGRFPFRLPELHFKLRLVADNPRATQGGPKADSSLLLAVLVVRSLGVHEDKYIMPSNKSKPKKPENVTPSPRFRHRTEKTKKSAVTSGMRAALLAARELTNTEASGEYFSAFMEQVKLERNDRGAAILAAINTENALRYAISRRLAVTREEYDNLFGRNGPMGTFDLKIRMAQAMNIFGRETKDNLLLVRTIRNAFAHAHIPITFRTAQIKHLCVFLVIQFVLHPKSVKVVDGEIIPPEEPVEARQRFNNVCETLSHNLMIYGSHCLQKPRTHPDWGGYNAWLTPEPLP